MYNVYVTFNITLYGTKTDYPVYLVYQYKAQTNFNNFKEHTETTAFQKMPIKSCDYQDTLKA